MNTRQLALTAVYSALVVAIAYARGLAAPSLPGLFEFMTVLIFVGGYCFGQTVGIAVGGISLVIYMLIPYPFAHPAAWLYTTSPVLLFIMMVLGAIFGYGGWLTSKMFQPESSRFALKLGLIGFFLTFLYDVFSSIGFAVAYPVYSDIWTAIYLTFIPLYYPWPPIIHTVTNTVIFVVLGVPLIKAVKKMPEILNITAS
ncbi:ECF transporter S component [Candidatus Bathyarchaeota archaeon]|nr:ECF transporter S component [Candidatus Bathyarchaeota archaeon]